MQAATMSPELVMTDAVAFSSADAWLWTRRILLGALIVSGVALL